MIQVWPKSIPYSYTQEVTHRFKGLDLTDKVPELWIEVHDIVQGAGIKTIPKKKKCKKEKWLSEEALYKELWKEEKWKAKEKMKYTSIWMQISKE